MKRKGLHSLRVALLCATFLYPATAARAEPISTAIGLSGIIAGGLGVSATVAGAIGGAIISGGISVGASLIASALRSNPDEASNSTPSGFQGEMTAGAVTPRNRVFGKMAVAGNLNYWRVHSENNVSLQLDITLASGPHDLFGIIDSGELAELELLGADAFTSIYGIVGRKWSGNGAHTATVKFFHGYFDQYSDPDLIAAADPAAPWLDTFRGRGVCHAVVSLFYIPDVYPDGIPGFEFVIGARVYDRRKDSTNGGAGAHRWSDQHTWEHSDNPTTTLYEYERGLVVGDVPVIGRQLAPVDLIDAYFVSSANICDEAVPLKAGGTEPRYRIGMNVGADRDFVSVERDFCMAMAGDLVESVGAYGPVAGVAQAAAMTFTDDDLVDGAEVRFSPKRSRSDLVNAIYGAFSDPEQNYRPDDYSPRFSLADEAADGGRFELQRDVLMIPSETQAQRVTEIVRRDQRRQASAGVTLKHKFSPLESSDWVRWISARRNFDKYFRITHHSLNDDRTIVLALKETHADVFGWNENVDQLDPREPTSLPGYGALITTVPDFALFQLQIGGAGELTIPALHCVWNPILDRTVDRVTVRYRVGTDDTTIKFAPPFEPQDGEGNITDGIQPSTPYQASAIISTTPPRTVEWTEWVPITAPANHIIKQAASVSRNAVGFDGLAGLVRQRFAEGDAVRDIILRKLASIQFQAKFADYERRLRAKIDLDNADNRLGTRITTVSETVSDLDGEFAAYQIFVAAELAEAMAAAQLALTSIATLNGAFSAFQLSATTQLGALESTVSIHGSSLTTLGGEIDGLGDEIGGVAASVASLESSVTASIGSLSSTVSTQSTAIATIQGKLVGLWGVKLDVNGYISSIKAFNDGTLSSFVIGTDYFQIASPSVGGGAGVTVYQVGTRGGAAAVTMKGVLINDGAIITKSIFGDGATFLDGAHSNETNFIFNNAGHSPAALVSLNVNSIMGRLHINAAVIGDSAAFDFFGDTIKVEIWIDGGYWTKVIPDTVMSGTGQRAPSGAGLVVANGISAGTHLVQVVISVVANPGAVGNPTRVVRFAASDLSVLEPRDSRIFT